MGHSRVSHGEGAWRGGLCRGLL